MKLSYHIARFFFLAILIFSFASKTQAASIYLAPASGNLFVGQTITVTIKVNTENKPVNTAEATIQYSTDTLTFVRASQGSTFSLAIPDSPKAGVGTVYFGGGIINPGYTGSSGTLGSVTFRAKTIGVGTLSITSGAALLNDGFGTNVYNGGAGATFNITQGTELQPQQSTSSLIVFSNTHPEPSKWFSNNAPSFGWNLPEGATGFSYIFNQKSDAIPNDAIDSTTFDPREKFYENIADGIWYFHIKAKDSSGFTDTTHFKIQIDTTLPESFTLEANMNNGKPEFIFEAKDLLSGIDHYSLAIDGKIVEENAISPFAYDGKLKVGRHTATVTAYDGAGNARLATRTIIIQKDYLHGIYILLWIIIILLTLILACVILIILILRHKRTK